MNHEQGVGWRGWGAPTFLLCLLLGLLCLLLGPLSGLTSGLLSGQAMAQTNSGFSFDSSLPIEISADKLEVSKDENSAVFQGNVAATQGDMSLTADRLNVLYREDGENDSAESPFKRIDARGNVAIKSPSETGYGDWAVYDVDAKIITVGGNVKLVRGDNIISGNRLVLDLNTGQSKIEGGGNGGRVRAVLKPRKKKSSD